MYRSVCHPLAVVQGQLASVDYHDIQGNASGIYGFMSICENYTKNVLSFCALCYIWCCLLSVWWCDGCLYGAVVHCVSFLGCFWVSVLCSGLVVCQRLKMACSASEDVSRCQQSVVWCVGVVLWCSVWLSGGLFWLWVCSGIGVVLSGCLCVCVSLVLSGGVLSVWCSVVLC